MCGYQPGLRVVGRLAPPVKAKRMLGRSVCLYIGALGATVRFCREEGSRRSGLRGLRARVLEECSGDVPRAGLDLRFH